MSSKQINPQIQALVIFIVVLLFVAIFSLIHLYHKQGDVQEEKQSTSRIGSASEEVKEGNEEEEEELSPASQFLLERADTISRIREGLQYSQFTHEPLAAMGVEINATVASPGVGPSFVRGLAEGLGVGSLSEEILGITFGTRGLPPTTGWEKLAKILGTSVPVTGLLVFVYLLYRRTKST